MNPHLLHISQCDGLRLVASVGPTLACVPSGASNPGGRLSQPVEQCHLFCQAEGAEVWLFLRLTLILTLVFFFHFESLLGNLSLLRFLRLPGLPRLLPGGGALLGRCLQAEGGEG